MVALNKLTVHSKATEVNTVSGRIVAGYEKNPVSDDPYLAGVLGELKTGSGNLTLAVKRMKAESKLEEADAQRDEKVRSIYYLIQGYKYHPDKQISSAAVIVGKVFDNYGMDIIKESYAVESSHIESMLKDFEKPKIQVAVNALPGLRQLIVELSTTQAEFEAASVAYEEEKSVEGELESATKIKQQVVSIINDKLVNYLIGICLANEEKYGNFARTVAQLIDDNNSAVKKRSGKNGGTKE